MRKFVVCSLLALAGWLAVAEAVEAGCRRGGGRLFSGRLFHRGASNTSSGCGVSGCR